MALPNSRNRTYNLGDKVFSQDLNEMQDWIVDHQTAIRSARDFAVSAGPFGTPGVPANWAPNLNGDWESTIGSPGRFYLDIPLHAGCLITGVTVYIKHLTATAGLITAKLEQHDISAGLRSTVSDVASSAASAAWQALVLANFVGLSAHSGTVTYNVHIDGTATVATRQIGGCKVTYTRP